MLRKYHLIVFFENSRFIHLCRFLKYFASFVNVKERSFYQFTALKKICFYSQKSMISLCPLSEKLMPSRQILFPRTSWESPPHTSWRRLVKILFDIPRDVSNWRPGDVSIGRPGDVSIGRPGDILIWRSRDVATRLVWDVPKVFSARSLEDLLSTQT